MLRKIALSTLVAAATAAGVGVAPQTATATPNAATSSIATSNLHGAVSTLAAASGTVKTGGDPLVIRGGASRGSAYVGSLPNGARVDIICQTRGQSVTGTYGTSNIWDYVGNGYVADTYVYTGRDGMVAPECGGGSTSDGFALNNNYPYKGQSDVDPWNFYKSQCTSFAAWALRDRLGVPFTNSYKGRHWGNAKEWLPAAQATGMPVSTTPHAGDIAVRTSGTWGHVAFVARVNGDGSYVVEEYNWAVSEGYGTRTLRPGDGQFNYFLTIR